MVNLKQISDSQARNCIKNGEFGKEIIAFKSKVVRFETTIPMSGGGCHFDNFLVTTGDTPPSSSHPSNVCYYDDETSELCWNIYDEGAIAPNAQWIVKRDGAIVSSGTFISDGQQVQVSLTMKEPDIYEYTLYADDGYSGLSLLDSVNVEVCDDDTTAPGYTFLGHRHYWVLWWIASTDVFFSYIGDSTSGIGTPQVYWSGYGWTNLEYDSGAGVWHHLVSGDKTPSILNVWDTDNDRSGDALQTYAGLPNQHY